MPRMRRVLTELVGLTAIAGTAALCYRLAEDWLTSRQRSARAVQGEAIQVGDQVLRHPVDTAAGPVVVVIYTDDRCPYCRASVSLHAEVVQALRNRGHGVAFVVPASQSESFRKKLAHHPSVVVLEQRDVSIVGRAVPTVILLQDRTRASHVWVGKVVSRDAEKAMLNAIETQTSRLMPEWLRESRGEDELSTESLQAVLQRDTVMVVDPRERDMSGFLPDVLRAARIVNIPASELGVRAPYELRKDNTYIVDCTPISERRCEDLALYARKYAKSVYRYRAGEKVEFCESTVATNE
jgi:hypothetical protein